MRVIFITFYRQFSPLQSQEGHIRHYLSSIFATQVPWGSYSSLFIVNFRHSSSKRVIYVTFYRKFSPLKSQEGHLSSLFTVNFHHWSPKRVIFVTIYRQFSPLKSHEGYIRHFLSSIFATEVPRGSYIIRRVLSPIFATGVYIRHLL